MACLFCSQLARNDTKVLPSHSPICTPAWSGRLAAFLRIQMSWSQAARIPVLMRLPHPVLSRLAALRREMKRRSTELLQNLLVLNKNGDSRD